jgi:hypothetical protein
MMGLGLLAVGWSLLQLVMCKRRDLGPLTIALVAAALTLPGSPSSSGLALAAGSIALLSWLIGAKYGVGRLALDGGVALFALGAAVAPAWLPVETPLLARLGPVIVAGLVATAIAVERAGAHRSGPAWYRRVPISVRNPNGTWDELRG